MPKVEFIGNVKLIYLDDTGDDIYNEGDEVEDAVLNIVKASTSYDTHVLAMNNDNRWPLLYELSKRRQNIVEPMDIGDEDVVLEVGAGMGAVTGAIADRARFVDCVEPSARRSRANAYRNRNFENINIMVGNFESASFDRKYDVIILNGVLEYATSYIHTPHPYDDFLKKLYCLMEDSGRLYIAIENKLGLKYFAGCAEDHLGSLFSGIEGYRGKTHVRTFSKSEIESLLNRNGFSKLYFYYPYPDYKLPTEIFSDDYLPNADSFFGRYEDMNTDRFLLFDEYKVYQGLIGTEEIKVLFNSFLIEARK